MAASGKILSTSSTLIKTRNYVMCDHLSTFFNVLFPVDVKTNPSFIKRPTLTTSRGILLILLILWKPAYWSFANVLKLIFDIWL